MNKTIVFFIILCLVLVTVYIYNNYVKKPEDEPAEEEETIDMSKISRIEIEKK